MAKYLVQLDYSTAVVFSDRLNALACLESIMVVKVGYPDIRWKRTNSFNKTMSILQDEDIVTQGQLDAEEEVNAHPEAGEDMTASITKVAKNSDDIQEDNEEATEDLIDKSSGI